MTMTIRVLMFGSLANRVGVRELPLELAAPATVGDALALLAQRYPALREMRGQLAAAVNLAYVRAPAPLAEGDELALIPPVSGG